MKFKRYVCIAMALAVLCCCSLIAVNAADVFTLELEKDTHALSKFDMNIQPKGILSANTSFYLRKGETVTVKGSYSQFDAEIDIGVIDENGSFHYFEAFDGSFAEEIKADKSAYYTLAVRNNSDKCVDASGYISYLYIQGEKDYTHVPDIPSRSYVEKYGYPRNAEGETYGKVFRDMDILSPDLILSINREGVMGYTKQSEVPGASVNSPEEAMEYMKNRAAGEIKINLYKEDGETVIGKFITGSGH